MSINKIAGFFWGNFKRGHFHESIDSQPNLAQITHNPLTDPNRFREKRNKIAELCSKMHHNPKKAD